MTEDEQRSEEFKAAIMGVQQGVMDAAPEIWASTFEFTYNDNAVTTGFTMPTGEPDAGAAWVWERAGELTGEICTNITGTTTSDLTISTDAENSNNWIIINSEVMRDVMTRAMEDGLPQVGEPECPQAGFESSSPLRAEDDQDDTWGTETDNSREMGTAEQWFHDKIRVRT